MDKPTGPDPRMHHSALVQVGFGALAGVCAAIVAAVLGATALAPLIGWDVAASTYLAWTWFKIGKLDADGTAEHAVQEDQTRGVTDLILLAASAASLVAVGFVIVRAADSHGAVRATQTALGTASVVVSWLVVHTTYLLRYAKIYHSDTGGEPGADGGVDFNQKTAPRYSDFAYLAFTLGMTFQVSDTPLTSSVMRRTALRHALLSYLYGTVIIAAAINLVAGLNR